MIRGVLFDKDGTLIDFYTLWIAAAVWSVGEIVRLNNLPSNMEEYILDVIGVQGGEMKPDGALAYKVYEEIAEDICIALREKEIDLECKNITKQLIFFFEQYIITKGAKYTEITNTARLVDELKSMGIYVGMSTADTMDSAIDCLEKLGVIDKFDYIGADDGVIKPKPHPAMVHDFIDKYALRADEVMIVGDTYNDIMFAKNSGSLAVGVLSGVSTESDFGSEVDYVLTSVAELPQLIKTVCKNIS